MTILARDGARGTRSGVGDGRGGGSDVLNPGKLLVQHHIPLALLVCLLAKQAHFRTQPEQLVFERRGACPLLRQRRLRLRQRCLRCMQRRLEELRLPDRGGFDSR